MEGETFSHYRILRTLGGGGMGIVYAAEDLKLKRIVALKFLPPEWSRDEAAKQRFLQEARSASALDHQNICTIHDVDETPDGRMFLTMAYYEGETLKKRMEAGPLQIDVAVDVAMQVALGLSKAHQAGIVHRDIKPANLMITTDGTVKILDFGIAKLSDATGLTRTGITLGSVSYMAPEQLQGLDVDQQTDVWALGVVLYQMLTGRPPFAADTDMAVFHAILERQPRPLRELRPDIDTRLERIVERALQKSRHVRFHSATELRDDLAEFRVVSATPPSTDLWHRIRQPRVAGGLSIAVVLAATIAILMWNSGAEARWARREALPQIKALVAQERFLEATSLAERASHVTAVDEDLAALWPMMSRTMSLETSPSGAEVLLRDYSDAKGAWKSWGTTPLERIRLPLGAFRARIRKEGYETVERTLMVPRETPNVDASDLTMTLSLPERGRVPPGMVLVPGGFLNFGFVTLRGQYQPEAGDDFFIDQYEVTNADFKAFVDRGGYTSRAYWTDPFVKGGRTLSWEEGISNFRDPTGRPGPAAWTVGVFPSGREHYPVSGVSWFEASAYCRSTGKSLPTIYHWGQAASLDDIRLIVPRSNFGAQGPVAVGTLQGMGRWGTFDMAGNVKEWAWNASTDSRYILGGSWVDAPYMFSTPEVRTPWDRSPTNGFRCAKYNAQPLPPVLTRDMPLPRRDYDREAPASDERFEAYRAQFSYDPASLNARVESVNDQPQHWRRETITFAAGYPGERVTAYLYLPKTGTPPYQTVVYFPGGETIRTPAFNDLSVEFVQRVIISGRALLFPVYKGTYERNQDRLLNYGFPRTDQAYKHFVIAWVRDFMRSLDYLETRPEIDAKKLAYLGLSWGGQLGPIMTAVDPRIKAAVWVQGGLPMQRALPEVDTINFVRHVTIPVLMLGGQYDYIYPLQDSQRPLFNLLGTAKSDKRHVVFDGMGHDLHQTRLNESTREILAWLDRYLGPAS